MAEDLYRAFKKTVREYQMIHKGEEIIAGVSGGADSVCLLFLLCQFREELDFSVRAVHVNHMIRGEEADRDQAFVEALCRELRVPLHSEKVDVPLLAKERKLSLEEAGRIVRYQVFSEHCGKKNGKIAVAHNLEDNAETVLLNLVRGSGIRGLSGIRPVGEQNGCTVIRPLLFTGRKEIEAFLSEKGQTFCEDHTNQDTGYSRNAIRHQILPGLQGINGQAAAHITKTAGILGEIEGFLERETEAAFQKTVSFRETEAVLRIPELSALDPVLQKRVVLQAVSLCAGSRKDLSSLHVDAVLNLSENQSGKQVSLPYGLLALRQYQEILIRKDEPRTSMTTFEIRKEELDENGREIILDGGLSLSFRKIAVNNGNRGRLMGKNQYTKAFDYDKIVGVIKVGEKLPGDYIVLKSGRKTLKKLFTDEKIPLEERQRLPVLKDGQGVLWVVGSRSSELQKLSETTTMAVIIETHKGGLDREY